MRKYDFLNGCLNGALFYSRPVLAAGLITALGICSSGCRSMFPVYEASDDTFIHTAYGPRLVPNHLRNLTPADILSSEEVITPSRDKTTRITLKL